MYMTAVVIGGALLIYVSITQYLGFRA